MKWYIFCFIKFARERLYKLLFKLVSKLTCYILYFKYFFKRKTSFRTFLGVKWRSIDPFPSSYHLNNIKYGFNLFVEIPALMKMAWPKNGKKWISWKRFCSFFEFLKNHCNFLKLHIFANHADSYNFLFELWNFISRGFREKRFFRSLYFYIKYNFNELYIITIYIILLIYVF